MFGLSFHCKLHWGGSYTISIAKTASKKIGTLISSIEFLSPEVALYLYKSTMQPCMEYYCHVWAGAPSCYLGLLDKGICRTVSPSLAVSLELLAYCWNVASSSLFYQVLCWYIFIWTGSMGSTSFFLREGLFVILVVCMIFLSPFLDVKRMYMSTVSFLEQLASVILFL